MRDSLIDLLQKRDVEAIRELLSRTAPAEIAHVLREMPPPDRLFVLQALDQHQAVTVFELLGLNGERRDAVAPVASLAVEAVSLLLTERQFGTLRRLLSGANPVDVARLLEAMPPDQAAVAFRLLPKELAVGVFEQLDLNPQQALLHAFSDERVQSLLAAMSPDDRAALLDEVPAMVTRRLLQLLSPAERKATLSLLGYEEGTAGRVMTPDFVDLRKGMTVAQAMERIRRLALTKETIYYAYVMDAERRLEGTVSLRELVIASPEALVGDIMTPDPKAVATDADQEQVARLLKDYDLLAVPVVDHEGRLVGIVTWDDVVDIMENEVTEDIYHMAGLGVKERVDSPLFESARRRLPWLGFNMAWAFAGAAIIGMFQGTLEQMAALAIFMPLVAGQAGNAGIQTATIVIRSMATGETERISLKRVLMKEWGVGLLKAILFGSILFAVAYFTKGNIVLAVIAGAALMLNVMIATTAGVLAPFAMRRIGVDPATVAGVFDTMLADIMGFLIYLGLATIFLAALLRNAG